MKSLKILYYSVHEPLEYDDLQIFTSKGHRVFSLGCYRDPSVGCFVFRPGLPQFYQPDLLEKFNELGISEIFLNEFDVILVNNDIHWINLYRNILKNRFVVLRTIGQSNLEMEGLANQLSDQIYIVRYSPREKGLPGFAKTDAAIYFGKNLENIEDWVGGGSPITFHNRYPERTDDCFPSCGDYQSMVSDTGTRLFGAGNEGVNNWAGLAPFSEMQQLLKNCACYVYVWSTPPSYTLSLIEAMLVGAPVIAPSVKCVSSFGRDTQVRRGWTPARYEIEELLSETKDLLYDDIDSARRNIEAAASGKGEIRIQAFKVRDQARQKFDLRTVADCWDAFFASVLGH